MSLLGALRTQHWGLEKLRGGPRQESHARKRVGEWDWGVDHRRSRGEQGLQSRSELDGKGLTVGWGVWIYSVDNENGLEMLRPVNDPIRQGKVGQWRDGLQVGRDRPQAGQWGGKFGQVTKKPGSGRLKRSHRLGSQFGGEVNKMEKLIRWESQGRCWDF